MYLQRVHTLELEKQTTSDSRDKLSQQVKDMQTFYDEVTMLPVLHNHIMLKVQVLHYYPRRPRPYQSPALELILWFETSMKQAAQTSFSTVII